MDKLENNRRQEDKEQGRFEGMVIQKLDDLQSGQDELKGELHSFKTDAYDKINQNTNDLSTQKGWIGAIGLFAGIAGGFIKGFFFKQ